MKLAILDDYQNCALSMADWSPVKKDAEITVFNDHKSEESDIVARLKDFEIVCCMRERTPFDRALFEKLPNLKLLVTSGMHNRGIDLEAAKDNGVTVCGTPSVGRPTADLAWGLILALARNIAFEDRAVRAGGWQTTIGIGLEGKTLGIVGLGKLGGRMAEIGKAFGMNIIAWNQNLTKERCAEIGVDLATKEELMKRSDFITVHMVLSDRSRGLIGAADLAQMKPTAFIVNTSRGPIIDEDALADALKRKAIAGAGLDVFETEPLPANHPFRTLENTVITPHLGYVEQGNYKAYHEGYVKAVRGYLDGKPVAVMGAH